MYDELIRQFRDKAERHRIEGKPGLARDYTHAADAIGELWREVKKCRKQHSVIPAADVVEVVRCKDCIHRDPEDHKCDCGGQERQGCPLPVRGSYFCAHGKRKDGGQEE